MLQADLSQISHVRPEPRSAGPQSTTGTHGGPALALLAGPTLRMASTFRLRNYNDVASHASPSHCSTTSCSISSSRVS